MLTLKMFLIGYLSFSLLFSLLSLLSSLSSLSLSLFHFSLSLISLFSQRMKGAFVPGIRTDFGEGNADLYGPCMIVFTLISIFVFTMKEDTSKAVCFII